METVTEEEQAEGRIINLNTCEVWCPLHKKNVCVIEKCLAGRGRCRFREGIHFMGRVICTWPEDAPSRES